MENKYKILFLGYDKNTTCLINFLLEKGFEVAHTAEKITVSEVEDFDVIISFGYQHILSQEIIDTCKRPPLNLHISLLPYNRGSHPNFWAWYENTPHGVTIHHIDRGLDTGDIVFQEEVFFEKETTLSDSYRHLRSTIEQLFIVKCDEIIRYSYSPTPQSKVGSKHLKKDLPAFSGGWDQTIDEIKNQL